MGGISIMEGADPEMAVLTEINGKQIVIVGLRDDGTVDVAEAVGAAEGLLSTLNFPDGLLVDVANAQVRNIRVVHHTEEP